MKTIKFLTLILVIMLPLAVGCGSKVDKSTVGSFDVRRYMGTWYQIVRIDHWREKPNVDVTIHYRLQKDGSIAMLSTGYVDSLDGEHDSVEGNFKRSSSESPAELSVSYFGPFYSEYNILELDQENYSYVLIGGSTDKKLWVLSRTPQMSQDVLDMLLKKAKKRGYDTSNLIYVKPV